MSLACYTMEIMSFHVFFNFFFNTIYDIVPVIVKYMYCNAMCPVLRACCLSDENPLFLGRQKLIKYYPYCKFYKMFAGINVCVFKTKTCSRD